MTSPLSPRTMCRLVGVPAAELAERPSAALIDPVAMAGAAVITFRDLPDEEVDEPILFLRRRLRNSLAELGAEIVDWNEAQREVRRGRQGNTRRVVDRRVQAVIDVPRSDLIAFALEDQLHTQVVTIAALDEEFLTRGRPYEELVAGALRLLLRFKSELLLGCFLKRPGMAMSLSFNLDDSILDLADSTAWIDWVQRMFVPKAVAPLLPIPLARFVKTSLDLEEPHLQKSADALLAVSRVMAATHLFPRGAKFCEMFSDPRDRTYVAELTDGRNGYSLGFIALGWARYRGAGELNPAEWSALPGVEGLSRDECREREGIWYVRIGDKIVEVPAVQVLSSVSGADKSNLQPRELGLVDLTQGRLKLCTPGGVDPERDGIRPSYDTYAMLGATLGAALAEGPSAAPKVIIHFHGYPHPKWLRAGYQVCGSDAIGVSCGTPQAGILNLLGAYDLFSAKPQAAVLVEPGHGSNIICSMEHVPELLGALQDGAASGLLRLGGENLSLLRSNTAQRTRGQAIRVRTGKALAAEFASLLDRARALGAVEARVIEVSSLGMESLSARLPASAEDSLHSPRAYAAISDRAALAGFERAIVFALRGPATSDAVSEESRRAMLLQLHRVAAELESQAFYAGNSLTIAAAEGSCRDVLCFSEPTCPALEDGGRCLHPLRCRPTPEALGIDRGLLKKLVFGDSDCGSEILFGLILLGSPGEAVAESPTSSKRPAPPPELERLIHFALSKGANDAVIIPAGAVVLDPRVQLKCMIPTCPAAARCANCPPNGPALETVERRVAGFEWGVLFRVSVDPPIVAAEGLSEATISGKLDPGGALLNLGGHYFLLYTIGRLLQREARALSFSRSWTLGAGGCREIFCHFQQDCRKLSGGSCRHPDLAAPSMESCGMDVFAMSTQAGWPIYPIGARSRADDVPRGSLIGLTLVARCAAEPAEISPARSPRRRRIRTTQGGILRRELDRIRALRELDVDLGQLIAAARAHHVWLQFLRNMKELAGGWSEGIQQTLRIFDGTPRAR